MSQPAEIIGGMTRRMHVPLMVAVVLGAGGVPVFSWARHAIFLTPVLVGLAWGFIRAGLHRMGLGQLVADMSRPVGGERRPCHWLRLGEEGGLVVLALLAWHRYHQRRTAP